MSGRVRLFTSQKVVTTAACDKMPQVGYCKIMLRNEEMRGASAGDNNCVWCRRGGSEDTLF
jgi:hypothetical protein